MVEFAIVLPVLVMLLFGIVQFSIAYNRQQALHAAALEGARTGAIETSTLNDITTAVDNALTGITFDNTRTVTVSPNTTQPCLNNAGGTVTVTVAANSVVDIPLWSTRTVGLTGRAQFRCE